MIISACATDPNPRILIHVCFSPGDFWLARQTGYFQSVTVNYNSPRIHTDRLVSVTSWYKSCIGFSRGTEVNEQNEYVLKGDLLYWLLWYGLRGPTITIFTLEKLCTSRHSVYKAGCLPTTDLTLKVWKVLGETLVFSPHWKAEIAGF